jgi:multidrug resistance efflux pump
MTDIMQDRGGFFRPLTEGRRPLNLAGKAKIALSWRRTAKYSVGALLLAIGVVSTYENVFVRTSREAVINGRVVVIRAPMDGFVATSVSVPGSAVSAGAAIGQIADPQPDDSRAFALQQEAAATQRDRDGMLRRVANLEQARREADAQAEAYRLGRVQQDELRLEEMQASLAAAMAREADAVSAVQRGTALHLRGFQSDEAYERARHAQEIAQYETIAARKRVDSLGAELKAARTGTYLGDNYNDVPSSFQRARELVVRIDEAAAELDKLARKAENVSAQLAAERERFAARAVAALTAPISGNLWTMPAVSGEYVRKGQELLTVVDCSTAMVTASVTDREFNELRLGDAVRFRVAGTPREYAGSIAKLGLASTGGTFAISPEEHRHQLAVNVPDLKNSPDDTCAIGRTGEVIFGNGDTARIVALLRRSLGLS